MSQIKDYVPGEDDKIKYVYPDNSEKEELVEIIKELVAIIDKLEINIAFYNEEDGYNGFMQCPICDANVGEGDHYEGCPVSEARRLKYYISRKLGIQFNEEK